MIRGEGGAHSFDGDHLGDDMLVCSSSVDETVDRLAVHGSWSSWLESMHTARFEIPTWWSS